MKYIIILFSLWLLTACGSTCEPGPVIEDCACEKIYKPVCGCDKVTYDNECMATCDGIGRWSEGACDD